ncbi:MAG: (2Fe-2S)-binding protein [Armatimonadetes bacterium]|nr:(2Fe-2S)-binding protein [Armatimonadota bacterium]
MAVYKINLNGKLHTIEAEPDMPLLWAIRDLIGLTGTKYGCGIGSCGACTVLVDSAAKFSCRTLVSEVGTAKVITIEGLSKSGLHPLQKAWIEHDVPQCGYCQTGQIMRAASLLAKNPKPTQAQIIESMDGNLCRCGTYVRILEAVTAVAKGAK